jgi:hypothetical protein
LVVVVDVAAWRVGMLRLEVVVGCGITRFCTQKCPANSGAQGQSGSCQSTPHEPRHKFADLTSTLVPSSLPLLQRHLAAAAERLHVPVERGCS